MSLPSCFLTEMTMSERKAATMHAQSIAVLPVGATEQHGPHLPVGTDSLIGQVQIHELTQKRQSSDGFYFAPQLQVSKSTEHLDFSGTLSLDRDVFVRSISSAIAQLRAWGFPRIAVLNTHGGNGPVLRSLVRESHARGQTDIQLLDVSPNLDEGCERENVYGIHAGDYETSLLLATVPEFCRMEKADTVWIDEQLPHPDLQPENAPATFSWTTKDLSPSGTMGDATQATAEKGKIWIERVVSLLLTQLRST